MSPGDTKVVFDAENWANTKSYDEAKLSQRQNRVLWKIVCNGFPSVAQNVKMTFASSFRNI
jgi:hypothetical protein